MCKNRRDPDRLQMTVKCGAEKVLFACGITKARAETHRNTVKVKQSYYRLGQALKVPGG
jgi:hypothetical protein